MSEDVEAVFVEVASGDNADAAELERLARQLRAELLEFDVDNVEMKQGAAPPGTKGLEMLAVDKLLVHMIGSTPGLRSVVPVRKVSRSLSSGWVLSPTLVTVE